MRAKLVVIPCVYEGQTSSDLLSLFDSDSRRKISGPTSNYNSAGPGIPSNSVAVLILINTQKINEV
jgi:hypothetical protein